jgi:ribonuclease HII
MINLDFSFEQQYWNQGKKLVVGVDEVGRGPLAGPVVTCAVVLSPDCKMIEGIKDSKKIPKNKHPLLAKQLKASGLKFAIGVGTVQQINELGIVGAIQNSINNCLAHIDLYHQVLMDGLPFKEPLATFIPIDYIVKGDSKAYSIAAASIIAKDYRDNLMKEIGLDFPYFEWEKNAGYGTKVHREAILKHGPTIHHRELFIRKLV